MLFKSDPVAICCHNNDYPWPRSHIFKPDKIQVICTKIAKIS